MKTIPSVEDFDASAERHEQRMETWARPEADRFGTWHDWSPEDVDYLLTELAEGHWDDCGGTCQGFAMTVAGCTIASNANSQGEDGKLRAILDNFAMGLDWMLGTDAAECDPQAAAVANKVLELIDAMPKPEDFDYLGSVAARVHH